MNVETVMTWRGEEVFQSMENDTGAAEKDLAELIYKYAKQMCPVGEFERAAKTGQASWKTRRPGTLRNAITVAPSKWKGKGWVVYVPAQDSDTYYVRWVELGARKRSHQEWKTAGHAFPVPRQPFMRPALRKAEGRQFEIYKEKTRKTLA